MNLFKAKKVYLIGIKGVGMTALAEILKNLGIKVVGSDTKEKFFTDEVLKRKKIKFYEGFKEKNLKKELPVDLIISSVAYFSPTAPFNPEINLAIKLNLPLLTYPQALAEIFNQSFGIAICGSHGKSSTTAILGKIFQEASLDPTCLVGSEVIEWQSNALVSKNFKKKIEFLKKNENKLSNLNWIRKNLKKLPIFIIEADEYREAFLNYFPRIILLTNIDYDHPDYFENAKSYKKAYEKFALNLKEPKILITYEKINIPKEIKYFQLKFNSQLSFPYPFPGIHWQKNLQLVSQLIKILKIPEKIFLNSIKNFKGIKRRFEIVFHQIFKNKEIYFIDDYAHHPQEVLSFYQSLKEKFPHHQKIFVFQPHTFTRTHYLFHQFKKVFSLIKKDKKTLPIIFKTFPSAREKEILLKIKNLKKDIDLAKMTSLPYFDNENKLLKFLKSQMKKFSQIIITTVGAGDLYKILEKMKK